MKFNEYFKLKDVTINVTNYCNMAHYFGKYCDYCFENHRTAEMMTKEQCREILDKCYKNHLENLDEYKSPLVVSFFGGEPFTNFDVIEDALKYSKEKGYKIEFGVTTNLLELTDHMIDIIDEYELGILVSIDGIKEIHDRNRCNSYDLVKSNVKRLVDKHLEYLLEARMTIMPDDISYLLDSIKSIVDMGIVNIAPVPVTDVEWNEDDLINLHMNLTDVWQWLFDIYNDNENKKNISIKLVEDYLEKVLTMDAIPDQTKVCSAGSAYGCSIGVNGEIMPCHQRHTIKNSQHLIMGNIFDNNDIKTIDFNNFTRNSLDDCDKCVAKNICKGGCPSENLTVNGDANLMNINQCNISRIMTQVAINFQELLLNCSNIRSRRLNGLIENLKLLEYLKSEVLNKNYQSKEYLNNLLKFYEMLMDKENILLPIFRETFKMKINELININREYVKGE